VRINLMTLTEKHPGLTLCIILATYSTALNLLFFNETDPNASKLRDKALKV